MPPTLFSDSLKVRKQEIFDVSSKAIFCNILRETLFWITTLSKIVGLCASGQRGKKLLITFK